MVAKSLTKEFKQKDMWKAALRGCPRWMRRVTYFFCAYAPVNLVVFIIVEVVAAATKPGENGALANPWYGPSGVWMAFYSAAMALLYSRIHVAQHDAARRCPRGHPVSPSATFCEKCGEEIQEPEDSLSD